MKKRIIIAMTAVSLATGFLSFGQRNSEKMAEEPLLSCPEECCTPSNQSSDQCCQDLPATDQASAG